MMTLLSPLRYLTIRHGSKALFDLVLPGLIAIALTWLLLGWPQPTSAFGKDGYLSQLQGLLAILGGFFVAALTLLTAEPSVILASPVNGVNPPRLPNETAPLSRRRFLGYLFGYLAFSSFCLAGIVLLVNLIVPGLSAQIPVEAHQASKWAFLLLFNFWLAHVFIATLLGLFYFTERLHMSDAKVTIGKPDTPPQAAE